jgi:uncharacterized membrane protein
MMSWMVAIPLLGVTTGLRSMTPMALVCWYAYLGYLPVDGTWASWTAHLWVAITLSVLAVGELIADKLPRMSNRTAIGPLLWRLIMSGMAGSIAAGAMNGSGFEGVLLAVLGALLGAFGGFMVRRDLVEKLACKDWHVAVSEDLITILCAGYALHVVTG